MTSKKKDIKKTDEYIQGFADGIKTNQADWIDVINAKIKHYNNNKNSGDITERLNKVAVLEELRKEVLI